jgi:hypothetical protein
MFSLIQLWSCNVRVFEEYLRREMRMYLTQKRLLRRPSGWVNNRPNIIGGKMIELGVIVFPY